MNRPLLRHATAALFATALIAMSPATYAQEVAPAYVVLPEADETAIVAAPDEAEATPTLAEIAATDENLAVREGQGEEPDSMVMLSDVLFPFGESTLRAEAIETLRGVATELTAAGPLTLEGHTDDIGDEDFNIALGERRAIAVRDWLVSEGGLDAEQITVVGIGEADPLHATDGADNSAARALNRRVEFVMN
ncbi:Outer membrane protein OmpA [Monaibacterium marinum]|uniref:Outer membrane protein OmpA n=1 Tax=Pontivivens marinum TaxID=1690039 RepID=A0A2C9CVS9_9RHOB|nr:OmpA family protein [Monaibacterium marinum]SOH95368.1 Outer membrane protein OmpA [Monaibacterium marinum]